MHTTDFLLFSLALNNEDEVFQSLSWKADGTALATTSKDKKVRLWDPRANSISQSADSHSSNRESVTTWLGASNRILTSGFDSVNKKITISWPIKWRNCEKHDVEFLPLSLTLLIVLSTEPAAPGLR